jgi:preprotein translocase subunit SecA
VLKKREREVGELIYLRVFRNFFLQEIDNQWLEHLQGMESLRDGIGLRGYGQRDPKKEYQKEGFNLFLELMQTIKASVVQKMYHFVIEREDEVERLEAERRRRVEAQQQRMSASHAPAAPAANEEPAAEDEAMAARGADGAAAGGAPAAASRRARRRAAALGQGGEAPPAPKAQTVRREKPKIGRNDPCWCGSQKKYKNCHLRSDEETQTNAEP